MSKLDQIRALREARFNRKSNPLQDAARGRDPAPKKEPKSSRGEVDNGKQPLMASRPAPPRTRETKRGRGRPKVIGPRPWDQEGISRRTWYRNRAKGKS